MGTVDLFDPPSLDRADGSHHIASPGGYETWHFDAEQNDGRLRIVVDFHHGYPFDPRYVRRYLAYRCRPTRNRPPLPAEYSCVDIGVYENERRLNRATIRYISMEEPHLTVRFDTREANRALWGELTYRPRFPAEPIQKEFPAPELGGPQHWWVLAGPCCEVSGEIRIGDRKLSIDALGYHDHCFGTAPLGLGYQRWMRCRILLPGGAIAFELADDQILAIKADDLGIAEIPAQTLSITWDRRTLWGLTYPSAMTFGPDLLLRGPRVIDSSPASLRAIFDAYVDGEPARALCELVYPQRLRNRLAGWWISRKIGAPPRAQ